MREGIGSQIIGKAKTQSPGKNLKVTIGLVKTDGQGLLGA